MPTIERKQETISVWNACVCGRLLHSMSEGKRGTCASCWIAGMPGDTKTALNKLIGSAFRKKGPSDAEKGELIDNAFSKLERDEKSKS